MIAASRTGLISLHTARTFTLPHAPEKVSLYPVKVSGQNQARQN